MGNRIGDPSSNFGNTVYVTIYIYIQRERERERVNFGMKFDHLRNEKAVLQIKLTCFPCDLLSFRWW